MKPDRNTWKQFCQEPELSKEEFAAWKEMTGHVGDDGFFNFMTEKTQIEWQAAQDVEPTEDWTDLVAYADANRRLKRAEIAAWGEWQAKRPAPASAGGGEAKGMIMKDKLTRAQETVMTTLYDIAIHEGGAIILKNRYHSAAAALVRKGLARKIDRTPWRPLYIITDAGLERCRALEAEAI